MPGLYFKTTNFDKFKEGKFEYGYHMVVIVLSIEITQDKLEEVMPMLKYYSEAPAAHIFMNEKSNLMID